MVHACATIIGNDFFNNLAKIHPSLLGYFTHMSELPYNYTLTDTRTIESDEAYDISELTELIDTIKSDPLNKEHAAALIELSKKHLSWVEENAPDTDYGQAFILWTGKLHRLAAEAGLPLFQGGKNDDNSPWVQLCDAWLTYFKTEEGNAHKDQSLVKILESVVEACSTAAIELQRSQERTRILLKPN